ncbi:MAG: Hsp20/alpha crystallin family protein [Chloroflexi bacterium]|nr:Hsp20/alpha crystallin family protein [Chloroflexota bacterium]
MSMMRYDPFGPMTNMKDLMDRLFEESMERPTLVRAGVVRRALPVDMYETQNEIVLITALPGAKPEDVDISITGDLITIKARISSEAEKEEAKNWNWITHEVMHGEFSRSFTLPTMVQADKAMAEFRDGLLRLTLPKAEEVKPRQIKISGTGERTGAYAIPPTKGQAGEQMKEQQTQASQQQEGPMQGEPGAWHR